jgi:hypothetical protein
MSESEPTRLPPAALASMLLTTASRLQVLAREGIIPRAVRGRYELEPVVQGYIALAEARRPFWHRCSCPIPLSVDAPLLP